MAANSYGHKSAVPAVSRFVARAFLLFLAGIVLCAGCARKPTERELLDKRLREAGKHLVVVSYSVPDDAGARSIQFRRDALVAFELYMTHPVDPDWFLFIDSEGVITGTRTPHSPLTRSGELLLTRSACRLYIDGAPLDLDLCGWKIQWATERREKPGTQDVLHPRVAVADSFMRHELADGNCRVSSGTWELSQRGGGMARTDEEEQDYNFQRAVNPFSVTGSADGRFSYGSAKWMNYHGEARFYFGTPKTGEVVDTNTVPTGTDMMVAQGDPGGREVAFGWRGVERSFVLMSREREGEWRILDRWTAGRPPLTNWVKIGLTVEAGNSVEAWLDDVAIFRVRLPYRLSGPFHILAGRDPMEFDDVRIWSLPVPPEKGGKVYAKSRHFASKKRKSHSDPVQFDQWVESTTAFAQSRRTWWLEGTQKAEITTAFPLMGDFLYESIPYADSAGELPDGEYEFAFYALNEETLSRRGAAAPGKANAPAPSVDAMIAALEDETKPPPPRPADGKPDIIDEMEFADMTGNAPDREFDIPENPPLLRLAAHRDDGRWYLSGPGAELFSDGHREFTLRFCRRGESGNRIAVSVNGDWQPLAEPVDGAVYLSIARLDHDGTKLAYPHPDHHAIYCTNVTNEFFEKAATDWSWVEGSFRMACRWACQNRWNFMACGGTGVPFMTSKRTYTGDQLHEYYMSLRPVFPWDAGDASFEYNPLEDEGWAFFREHEGWYNRHDLNFSFCFDGRNPLSGYSIVFGGNDNTETVLLRKGEVVARRTELSNLFPTAISHHVIHWNWWKFTVQKFGGRVLVDYNDRELFDFTDPDPLDGGHVGFWTVRNGFTVARIVSVAEKLGSEPHVLYVHDDEPCAWTPLLLDSVRLTRDSETGLTRVTHTVGGGFHGIRHVADPPVDLLTAPILELPLRLAERTAVNLHMLIGDTSCVVRINAPLTGAKSLLTPEFEKGECFRIPVLDEEQVRNLYLLAEATPDDGLLRIDLLSAIHRLGNAPGELKLRTLTFGNSSNTNYLLAAADGKNAAGTSYLIGKPRFVQRQE